MDTYEYKNAIKQSADYDLSIRRRVWVAITVIASPLWPLPYLRVHWFRG